MKRTLPFLVATCVATVALGETIRIGTMELPLVFEGEPPTGALYDFTTNEIVRYYHPVVGFLGLSPDAPQPAHINEKTRATMVWRSPVFHDRINFFVDSGATNCVVSSAFVTNAAAIHAEWSVRTNLAASADQFLLSVSSGAVTNLPVGELRKRMRTLAPDGTMLIPAPEADGTDSELLESFAELSEGVEFEPLCLMEMSRQPVGTNEIWMVPVRTFWNRGAGSESDIAPLRLVQAEGEWCFMY